MPNKKEEHKKIEDLNMAISVLVEGVKVAQKAGVYELTDSRLLADAVDFIYESAQENKNKEEKKDEGKKD